MQAKSVLITRPVGQTKSFCEILENKGFTVKHLPLIELCPIPIGEELKNAFENLDQFDWMVFTSVNAVKYFFQLAEEFGVKFYFYPNLKIATVGEKTKLQLEQLGYRTNFVPIKYTAEVLADNMDDVQGKRILIPRSNLASNHYLEVFKSRGAFTTPISVYENKAVEHQAETVNNSLESTNYLTFASSSAVKAFHELSIEHGIKVNNKKIICIGPSTASTAKKLGYKIEAVADPHTVEGITNAIVKLEENVQTA